MAYFAKLDENNVVTQVNSVSNDVATDEAAGIAFLKNLHNEPDAVWKQGSYNTRMGKYFEAGSNTEHSDQSRAFRINYPSIGMKYDSSLDGFVQKDKPYNSWVLDNTTGYFKAPVDCPVTYEDGAETPDTYIWVEETQSWERY